MELNMVSAVNYFKLSNKHEASSNDYLSDLSDEDHTLALSIIEDLCSNGNIFVFRCPYGTTIWDRDSLFPDFKDDLPVKLFKRPVGMVLRGTLEVTEDFAHHMASKHRRRTTALIRPGSFFGLFESFADLHGAWRITSGVTRILISSLLGAKRDSHKYGLSRISRSLQSTLKFEKNATFNYQELINSIDTSGWTNDLIIFDADHIQKADVKNHLKDKTILQLRSLVRQNPTESHVMRIASHEKIWHPSNIRATATIRAILEGDLPVFRLASAEDEPLLPYNGFIKRLNNGQINDVRPHIFVPDYISSTIDTAYVYIDVLSGKVNPNDFGNVLSQMNSAGTRITPTEISLVHFEPLDSDGNVMSDSVFRNLKGSQTYCYKAIVEVNNKRFEVYRTIGMKKESGSNINFHLPERFENLLFQDGQNSYRWPMHLRSMIIIFPTDSN